MLIIQPHFLHLTFSVKYIKDKGIHSLSSFSPGRYDKNEKQLLQSLTLDFKCDVTLKQTNEKHPGMKKFSQPHYKSIPKQSPPSPWSLCVSW